MAISAALSGEAPLAMFKALAEDEDTAEAEHDLHVGRQKMHRTAQDIHQHGELH